MPDRVVRMRLREQDGFVEAELERGRVSTSSKTRAARPHHAIASVNLPVRSHMSPMSFFSLPMTFFLAF